MLTIAGAKGVIFDVDDTLLDGLDDNPLTALHSQARVQATRAAGRRHNLTGLATITPEIGHRMFHEAPIHSVEGAVWHTLFTYGIVPTEEIDHSDSLLREIVADKNAAYEELLRTKGRAYPGAVEFVKWVAGSGLKNRTAIASTALRRDIDIFLEMAGLTAYFPSDRIISHDDLTHAKPDPEAFNKAFLSLGLPEGEPQPSHCVRRQPARRSVGQGGRSLYLRDYQYLQPGRLASSGGAARLYRWQLRRIPRAAELMAYCRQYCNFHRLRRIGL